MNLIGNIWWLHEKYNINTRIDIVDSFCEPFIRIKLTRGDKHCVYLVTEDELKTSKFSPNELIYEIIVNMLFRYQMIDSDTFQSIRERH